MSRVAVILALALGSAPLAAQSASTGIIEGVLRDSLGRPVPQAEIVASHQDGFTRRQATSDAQGSFRLAFLPPGLYRLSLRRIGYRALVVNAVNVRAGRVERVAVTLSAAALQLDSVVVLASAVRINTSDTEFGTRLTPRELRLLPLPTEAHDLVAFTPGARPNQIWGAATAQANTYQLDGVAVNHPGLGGDFLQPATDWIEEIEVKGLGAGAEYGGFQGGLVNIVTRSGTDRFQGELRSNGESFHLNGSNLRVTEAGSEPSHRGELDGQLRGPVVRDRLHFAVFGQLVDRGARVLNRVRQVPGDFSPAGPAERELKLLGKLTWQAGRRDIVNGSLGRIDLRGDRFGLNGFQSAEATQRRTAGTTFYNLSWQRTWSPRSFVELKLAGFDGSDRRAPYAGPDVPGVATLLEVNPREYQNAAFRERREPRSVAATLNWDSYFRTFSAEHHLKIGGEQGYGWWIQERLRNGGLTWRPGERITPPAFDPADPATWVFSGVISSSWGGEVRLDSKVQNSALYAQDYIQVGRRLSINPGIRWGHWVGRLRRAGAGYFTAIAAHGWDPRIGAVLDLSGNGTLVAKAHWGTFHQNLFAGFFDRADGGEVYTNEERWEYTGPGFSDPRTVFSESQRDASKAWRKAQTIRLNEAGRVEEFKEPYLEQAIVGLEKSFGARLKAEALYVRRRNKNMVTVVDRNLAQNYTVYENVSVLDRFFQPLQFNGQPLVLSKLAVSNQDIIYWRGLVLSGQTGYPPDYIPPGLDPANWLALTYRPDLVLTNVPEATRRFDQLQLNATARYPTWWAQLSATLTRLVGNLNSLTGSDDYTTSGAGPFVRLNEQTNFSGDLNNQSRFELKLQAGGELPWRFRGGVFFTHFEGDRVTPTLTISDLLLEFQLPDTSSTGRLPARLRGFFFMTTAGQRIFVQPRGTYRYPSRNSLDLHLERGFPLGRTELILQLDAFNALAASTVTEVQTSVNGSLDLDFPSQYGVTRNRVPPRTLRLGVAARW